MKSTSVMKNDLMILYFKQAREKMKIFFFSTNNGDKEEKYDIEYAHFPLVFFTIFYKEKIS